MSLFISNFHITIHMYPARPRRYLDVAMIVASISWLGQELRFLSYFSLPGDYQVVQFFHRYHN